MGIYDYELIDNQGNKVSLADYKGKVLVIVNTATNCGFTYHYEKLQQLYEDYGHLGLEIIDIPCNQFAEQAPGTDEEIQTFCTRRYKTTFPRMKKSDVNGKNELPLYTYLKSQQGFKGFGSGINAWTLSIVSRFKNWNYKKNSDIKWNFTKFIIDRDGNVVKRFEPSIDMEEVEECLLQIL